MTCKNWRNKIGTSGRNCRCGSWKQHWINFSGQKWPTTCSVDGCYSFPTLGAHIYNNEVSGEKIVPMCDACNKLTGSFNLKGGITLVSANKNETCEKW